MKQRSDRTLLSSLFIVALTLAFVVSCATVPPAQNEERVLELVDVINERDADRIMEHSRRPFLFDSEIVELSNDLYVMWINAYNAGFSLPNASLVSLETVDSQTYEDFHRSREVRSYFERRLPEGATVARIQAQQGTFELLLGDEENGLPGIYGLRGPL